MTEVSAISTICKNCLFAKYENNTQVGCQFDRTDTVDNHPDYDSTLDAFTRRKSGEK